MKTHLNISFWFYTSVAGDILILVGKKLCCFCSMRVFKIHTFVTV